MSASTVTAGAQPVATADLRADIHETHTGVVALVGDRAYKAKKPIVTDFLDFSTVERRQAVCAREVALNRRLASQAYLGVAQLIGPDGGAAEPVIVMRRYDDADRLSTRVIRGDDAEGELVRIAAMLARFHEDAQRSQAIDACGNVPAVTTRWQQNMSELTRLAGDCVPGALVHDIDRLAHRFIAGRAALFAARIADRRIVDGHGDLLSDDIFCTDSGPVLLDCLEFDDSLRYVDGIDDAAFLAMDLEFLGRPDLADFFLACYRRESAETAPGSLVDFYIAYRAVVRAKVDVIRALQGDSNGWDRACRHLELALRRLRAGAVQFIVIGGGPGTGKTTLARGLAEHIEAQVISTDGVRRELAAAGVIGGSAGDYESGLYSPEQVAVVYDTVLRKAAESLAAGVSVILDGTWRDAGQRRRAREIARRAGSPITELVCTVGLAEAQARISGRAAGDSDASPATASAMASETWAWTRAHPIDTGRPISESVAQAQRVCSLAI